MSTSMRTAGERTNYALGLWLCQEFEKAAYRRASIDHEEMSPSGDEARFQGVLRGDKGEADFILRIVRERDSGKWRVAFVVHKPRSPKGESHKDKE